MILISGRLFLAFLFAIVGEIPHKITNRISANFCNEGLENRFSTEAAYTFIVMSQGLLPNCYAGQ